jgi:hypothetical protein
MNFQLGDYVCSKGADPRFSRVYQVVEIEDRPGRVECYGVFDYRCNPTLTRWGSISLSCSLEGIEHAAEMVILARVAAGEHLCSKPAWLKGWKRPRLQI